MTIDGTTVAVLVQTAMLAFWGGQVHRAIKDHDRRLDLHQEQLGQLDRRKQTRQARPFTE